MNKHLLATGLAVLVTSGGARAVDAAPHAFVSVLGANVGDCSSVLTACRTLRYAVGAVGAGGEVIVLTSGNFGAGEITIAKSVSITVAPGMMAVSNSPIRVEAGAADTVALRGLVLKAATPGTGEALAFLSGGSLSVDNCVIDGWNGSISFYAVGSPQAHLVGTRVRNNNFGLLVTPGPGRAPQVTIQGSRFENNANCGVAVASPGSITVSDSVASGNGWGFCAENSGTMTVEHSVASGNTNQGFVSMSNPTGGGIMRVGRSIASGNGVGFQAFPAPAVFESMGNNLVRGNGTDLIGSITIIVGN